MSVPRQQALRLVAAVTSLALVSAVLAAPSGASAAPRVGATTVTVSPTGVDRVGGGSTTSPYRTIQYAVSSVATGSTVQVAPGSYAPFTVLTPNVAVVGQSRTGVVVRGNSSVRGVVTLAGVSDRVSNLTVTGCVPNPAPYGSYEFSGSASVFVRNNSAWNSTVSNLIITHGTGVSPEGLPFGCYGVYVGEASGVVVSGNDISGQGEGVFVFRGGNKVKILSNVLHDNNVEVRNTLAPNDDFGGTGVGLFSTTGSPGVLVDSNIIYNNVAPSHDYVTDGGAFDVFQTSNATMTHNTIFNNENVLEAGAGTTGYTCANNVFSSNSVSGKGLWSTLAHSVGMILRCATNMQITNNTFMALDWYTFDIETKGAWSGALSNLTITGNRIIQTYHVVYAMLVSPLVAGITINANRYTFGGPIGLDWFGLHVPTLAAWRALTGEDSTSSTVSSTG